MSSSDEPRLLTLDEIKSILSRIAKPQIMASELREHVFKQVKTMYCYQLGVIKLKPSKIQKLADYIANKSERSFYHPGSAVGFNVAESVGQPATQLVLNTFHSAGQSGTEGFERFRRNIALRDYRKNEENFKMRIHMNNKDYSYEDLYIKAQSFVTVSIEDLLDTSRIRKERYPFIETESDIPDPVYTEDFIKLNSYKDRGCGIRLRFDREKLFLHRIPLETIALELEKISGGDVFTIFFGPHNEGVIDIYPNPEKLCTKYNKNLEDCCSIFEIDLLTNKLKKNKIGDFSNIISATLKKIPVINCISEVTEHYDTESDEENPSKTHVRVWINEVYRKKEGVPESKISELLENCGYNVSGVDENENYLIVESSTQDIIKEIKDLISAEDKELIANFSTTNRLSSSPLYLSAFYNIIMTVGTDLATVRNHPEVDSFQTISDSPTEIYAVYGIDVCRSYLEKEIYDLFEENSQSIAPRNIRIMVDWMTSGTHPISVNPKSVHKVDNSILRAFCFESPQTNIVKGSVLSTTEPLSNVSVRVLFGAQQTLGTGAFKVGPDPEIMELYESFKSKDSLGAFRLTSDTLRGSLSSSVTTSTQKPVVSLRPNIPQATLGLFDENLSEGSSFEF